MTALRPRAARAAAPTAFAAAFALAGMVGGRSGSPSADADARGAVAADAADDVELARWASLVEELGDEVPPRALLGVAEDATLAARLVETDFAPARFRAAAFAARRLARAADDPEAVETAFETAFAEAPLPPGTRPSAPAPSAAPQRSAAEESAAEAARALTCRLANPRPLQERP